MYYNRAPIANMSFAPDFFCQKAVFQDKITIVL